MSKGEVKNQVNDEIQSTCRYRIGKLLCMMRWTTPDIMNSVRGSYQDLREELYNLM
jgi:hypothetical protein